MIWLHRVKIWQSRSSNTGDVVAHLCTYVEIRQIFRTGRPMWMINMTFVLWSPEIRCYVTD